MKMITRKSDLKPILAHCASIYSTEGMKALVSTVHEQILSHKVKFPLLEFCAETLFQTLPLPQQLTFCDQIEQLKTEGGNVILGFMLQLRLNDNFNESIDKATYYTSRAHIWYICDIIGERVYGYALLHFPKKAIPELQKLAHHRTHWVVRSIGAGIHYAIKKGLSATHVDTMFQLLLTLGNSKNKEIRQGIGWAAKTTARFHPQLIKKYTNEIENTEYVANWFRKKIEIGLQRHAYAQRN